jgi:hypothetical protein
MAVVLSYWRDSLLHVKRSVSGVCPWTIERMASRIVTPPGNWVRRVVLLLGWLFLAFSFSLASPVNVLAQSAQGAIETIAPVAGLGEKSCKASEKGKSKSGSSEVCVRVGSRYQWVRTFSQNDVFSIAAFCSRWLDAALCGWVENTANDLLDLGPRGSDSCQRMFRVWIYRIASDVARGNYVAGTTYFKTALLPIARASYPACWNPRELREP